MVNRVVGVTARLFSLSMAVAVFVLISFSQVSAVEFGNIGGKPANPDPNNPRTVSIFVKELSPGQSTDDAVEVVNYTDTVKTLLVYATDSVESSGGSFACAQFVDEKKSVGSWVQFTRSEVTLEPNTSEVVDFTVTAPKNAQVGENNGCIVIQEKNPESQNINSENSNIAINFRTAIRLSVLVPGDIVKSLNIVGFAVIKEEGKYIIKPRVKNTGNVSLDTTLNTYVGSLVGSPKQTHTQESPILRDITSDWNIPYDPPFWGGWYKSYFTVSYDSNVTNGVGQSDNPNIVTLKSDQIVFFVMPSVAALLVLLPLALAVVAGILYGRRIYLSNKARRNVSTRTIVINIPTDIATVAKAHNIPWKQLAKLNKLSAPYAIRPGDKLKVPAQEQRSTDDIKPGSSSSSVGSKTININSTTDIEQIAKKYNVSWKKLAKHNNIKAPYVLRPGTKIVIPSEQSDNLLTKYVGSVKNHLPKFNSVNDTKDWEEITIKTQVDGIIVKTHSDIESLAKEYGVPWKKLAKINKLKPPYKLKNGDKIKVPRNKKS